MLYRKNREKIRESVIRLDGKETYVIDNGILSSGHDDLGRLEADGVCPCGRVASG